MPKRRNQHLLYSEEFQLKTKESCQSRNLTSSFLSTFNVGAPHTTINICIWLSIYICTINMSHICTINIFHICTFSYIVEDYFLGLNLKFDSVRLNFPKIQPKIAKKSRRKTSWRTQTSGCGTIKSGEIKSTNRLQQKSAGQGFFQQDRTTTGQTQKCIIIGISLPCSLIYEWGNHYNWTAL